MKKFINMPISLPDLHFINILLCGQNEDIIIVQKAYLKGKWVKFV